MKEYVEVRLLDDPDENFRVIAEGNRSIFQSWLDDVTNTPSNLNSYKDLVTGKIIRPSFIDYEFNRKYINDSKHLLYDNYFYQRIITKEQALDYIKELQEDKNKLTSYLEHIKLVKYYQNMNRFKEKVNKKN